jgi:transcriptional regulator with XRE-family HTH domain
MDDIAIGKTIKMERLKRNMKAKELAKKAGIAPTYLSEIENEKQAPSLKTLHKISVALGIKMEDLFLISKKYKEVN